MYVHHIGRSLRVSALIELVGKDTRALVDKIYSQGTPPLDGREAGTIPARKSGVITTIAYANWLRKRPARIASLRCWLGSVSSCRLARRYSESRVRSAGSTLSGCSMRCTFSWSGR